MSSALLSSILGLLLSLLQNTPTAGICSDGDVRLQDGETEYEGRIEVCYHNVWGTVCDYGINNAVATVVCTQSELPIHDPKVVRRYGGGTGPTFLEGLNCEGDESNLLLCSHDRIEALHDCSYGTAGVSCSPPCDENALRLLRNRVQICHNEVWGYICQENGWNNVDASVVCRELGFLPEGTQSSYDYVDPFFPYLLSSANCGGSEERLIDCPHSGVENVSCHNVAIVYCADIFPCNETGAVKLTHSNVDTCGRLELCYDGHWNSVCSNHADNMIASVVCRQLGYAENGQVLILSEYHGLHDILPNIPIFPDEVECNGNEPSLLNCYRNSVNHHCFHDKDLVIECNALECNDTDVRLVNGSTPHDGRVEICLSGLWGSVCDGNWDCRDAAVVCRQLGYNGISYALQKHGGDLNIHLDDVSCTGSEIKLVECMYPGVGLDNCRSGISAAGVICTDTTCVEGAVRLVGGPTMREGRVQMCYNGEWHSVCGDRWSETGNEANVVCSTLGYSEMLGLIKTSFDQDASPILPRDIQCNGDERALSNCSTTEHDPIECQQMAGVTCKANCVDGDVRLQDGTHPSNGRVEICRYGIWQSVCSSYWDHNTAKVVCRQLGYDSEDVEVTDVFGPGGHALSDFQCTGREKELSLCPSVATCDNNCDSAGVICTKDLGKCADEAGTLAQNKVDLDRFGVCEPYSGHVDICNDIFTVGSDYVFVTRTHGSQKNISRLFNQDILTTLLSQSSSNCHYQIVEVICNYFLSPCGTESSQVLPHSICPEDCSAVQMECPEWEAVQLGLNQLISCNDTSAFLSPLISCCIDLQHSASEEDSKSSVGGRVAGAVVGILVLIGAAVVTVVSIYLFTKWKRKQRVENLQMDIFAMPGSTTTGSMTGDNDAPGIIEISSHFMNKETLTLCNPYEVPILAGSGIQGSQPTVNASRQTRMNSCYLRELTLGKFIIKCDEVTLSENIGQGEFGVVYRARFTPQGKPSQEVAIKTLKGHFDQLEVNKFVEESLKMSRFKHAHVMGLIGVCLDAGSAPYIVMPYMANGSLLHYLKRERENLILTENADEDEVMEVRKRLMVMCSQIASGMEYLAKEKYVHRDLAARNCMIDSHFLIKITDFGLSEDVFLRNYFREGSDGGVVKLPVKWMAPESLSDGHFSEKSDVWSYGVTMWEIFSGGKAPYPGTDPTTLIQKLEEGDRMPKPINAACTEEIYEMMRKCWEMRLDDRPSFMELNKTTSKYVEHIAGYLELGYNPFAGMKKFSSITELKDNQMKEKDVESKLNNNIK